MAACRLCRRVAVCLILAAFLDCLVRGTLGAVVDCCRGFVERGLGVGLLVVFLMEDQRASPVKGGPGVVCSSCAAGALGGLSLLGVGIPGFTGFPVAVFGVGSGGGRGGGSTTEAARRLPAASYP